MELTTKVRRLWNKAGKAHRFTSKDIIDLVGHNYKRKNISSIFSKLVKRGAAFKGFERGLYIKVRDDVLLGKEIKETETHF